MTTATRAPRRDAGVDRGGVLRERVPYTRARSPACAIVSRAWHARVAKGMQVVGENTRLCFCSHLVYTSCRGKDEESTTRHDTIAALKCPRASSTHAPQQIIADDSPSGEEARLVGGMMCRDCGDAGRSNARPTMGMKLER